MNDIEKIKRLKKYLAMESAAGKHAKYQALPVALSQILGEVDYNPVSRFEEERWRFIHSQVNFCNKKVFDIGTNLGFFSFSAAGAGASWVTAFEGSPHHASIVGQAIDLLSLQGRMEIFNQYFTFDEKSVEGDIGFLLNVLHHIGDDYDTVVDSVQAAKKMILNQLNYLASKCNILIFQLGFNWRGNVNYPLFLKGEKKELIDFIRSGVAAHWNIEEIAVAVKMDDGEVVYKPLDDCNCHRDDALGEFLNRPLFILKSKVGGGYV